MGIPFTWQIESRERSINTPLCNEFTGCALPTCQRLESHGFQAFMISCLVCCRWHTEHRSCFSLRPVSGTSHESCFREVWLKRKHSDPLLGQYHWWKFISHTSLLEVEGNVLPSLPSSGESINQALIIQKTY